MSIIESFSVSTEFQEICSKFLSLRYPLAKNKSELIIWAISEFYERHKDGQIQSKLDQILVPKFDADYQDIFTWLNLVPDEQQKEIRFKLQEWNKLYKSRFGESV